MKVQLFEYDGEYLAQLIAETTAEASMLGRMALSSRQTEAVKVETTFFGESVSGWVYVTRRKSHHPEQIGGKP